MNSSAKRRYYKALTDSGCFYCEITMMPGNILPPGGRPRMTRTVDHIKCVSHGGSNSKKNLVCACTNCNEKRGTRDFVEFGTEAIFRRMNPQYKNRFVEMTYSPVKALWEDIHFWFAKHAFI